MKLTKKISFRVPFLICAVLFIGIGFVIVFYSWSQNAAIIESKENEIKQEAEILYTAVKNNMLAGEAPIAVELFDDFTRGNFIANIQLFRPTGYNAFSDNSTINRVNRYLATKAFSPKKNFPEPVNIETSEFKKSVADVKDVFLRVSDKGSRKLMIYKPLINQPKCSKCHGLNHVVRGVIMISTPVDRVYEMARQNVIFSIILYGIVVTVLTGIIIIFLRRSVISRIIRIGSVVRDVGQGNFKAKVDPGSEDEIGQLGSEINHMIEGLHERFKLSKFVSKSTLDHVRSDEEVATGGEKKNLTVLFSDVRDFTAFSENNDPAMVMDVLNKLMNIQTEIVNRHGGDVDKYVGDELMAVFEGEDMAIRALRAAVEIRDSIKNYNESRQLPIAVGIGINTGEMISGNMGSKDRLDRTVVGDEVNLGSRLCSLAGKNTIVMSEKTYAFVSDRVEARPHDPIKIKGIKEPVKIYSLRKIK